MARAPRAAALPARPTALPGAAGRARSVLGERGECRPQGSGVAWWVRARLSDTGSRSCVRHLDAAGSSWHLAGATVGSWARERPLQCPAGRGERGGAAGGLSPRHERPELRDGVTFPRSLRRHGRLSFSRAQPRVSQKGWQASALAEGWGPCRGAWPPGHRKGTVLPSKTF